MKYKVGDSVKIVSTQPSRYWHKQMNKFLGEKCTIKMVMCEGYKIKEDGGLWYWHNEMIEGLVEEEWTPKEGEYVRAIDGGAVSNCIFLFWNKEGKPVCVGIGDERNYEMGDDSYTVITWESVEQIKKQEKKERKLLMTDKEWEKVIILTNYLWKK